MRLTLRLHHLPVAIALVVVVIVWVLVEAQQQRAHESALRGQVLVAMAEVRTKLQKEITGNVQLLRALGAVIQTEPDMSATRWAALVGGMMGGEPHTLRAVAAAPDMVVRHTFPHNGNEAAIGLSYIDHPEQGAAAQRARDTGRVVIAGPVDLVQGGYGFIIRAPVMIPQASGEPRFWGLVGAVIDYDALLEAAGLTDPDLPYTFALTGADATGSAGAQFFGPANVLDDRPVTGKILLPEGSWGIAAVPKGGWAAHPVPMQGLRTILAVGALLILVPGLIMGLLMAERSANVGRLRHSNAALKGQMAALERARAEQQRTETRLRDALARAETATARFEDVARLSGSWVWETDADGRFTHVSDSYGYITGISPTALIGKTHKQIFAHRPEVLTSADWSVLEATVAARKPFSDFLYRAWSAADREVWLMTSGAPHYDSHGNFAGYRGAGRDVTVLQQARSAADEGSRAKSMFLATMSHEIRTPLNGVLGMAEVLDGAVTNPEQRQMVATIRESGEALMRILNDILDLSKIEAGKMTLETAEFDPADVGARIADLHRPAAREKGLVLEVELEGDDLPDGGMPRGPMRHGDATRVGQILHNLIGNAVKFTETGSVTVTLTNRPGAPLKLCVQDTGIGMSQDQIDRIFDEFTQADGGISRRYGGTGLGLSIVRRLASMMGGSVAIEAEPGVGCTVRVVLPLDEIALPPDALARRIGARLDRDKPAPAPLVLQSPLAPETRASTPAQDRAAIDGPAATANPDPAPPPSPAPPLVDVRRAGAAASAPRNVAGDTPLQGLRLLVADDNATNKLVLKAMLRTTGAEITMVADGREAVEACDGGGFDVLMLDISMPVMDGPTALGLIREAALSAGRTPPPAIAFTANVMAHQVAAYREAGFVDCIAKPVKREVLLETLSRHYSARREDAMPAVRPGAATSTTAASTITVPATP